MRVTWCGWRCLLDSCWPTKRDRSLRWTCAFCAVTNWPWSATQSLLRVGVKETTGAPYASQIVADAPLSCQTEFGATADIGRRYGAVSGDRNPIHMSALSAKLFGFKRAIAHGMWTNARALSCLLPSTPLEQGTLAVEFKTPLYLPGRASLWSAPL